MSGITDEAEFDKMRQGMTWEGHADKVKVPYLCVAGEFDELSPIEHSVRLVKAREGAEADGGLSGLPSLGRQRAGPRNLGPFPPVLVADWLADRVAGKPFASEHWYVRRQRQIDKKPL